MSDMMKTVDITPTPRVLRVLGELPFNLGSVLRN